MLPHPNSSIKKQVYDRISYLGTASKADLLNDFALTSSSMTRLLDDMSSQGLIIASGLGTSKGGRKPILFQCNPAYRYLFGLEISRIHSSLGLYDMHFNLLSMTRWIMDDRMTPPLLADHVADSARALLSEHGISPGSVLGLGIGSVGPLNSERGIILEPEHFPAASWTNVPICEMLEARLEIPVKLDNGANCALIGEHRALKSNNYQHILYVHAGTTIRFAMMSGGHIVRGASGAEGALGQMIIQTNGPRLHGKGNYGALEAFVSVPALEERVRTQLKIGRSSLLAENSPEQVTFASLSEALQQGDKLVTEQFTESSAYLGIGLANLINTLHPECVVLGGPLVRAHQLVFDTSVEVARKNTYPSPENSPFFTQGYLKEEAVATGAAIMLLNDWYVE
ncbi:ROK family protein [Paenibacillus sp. FSL R7-0312]|uniref:ROK family protein n=1 Tax=Paenibacillus sp. FSL R7-0312 TaxID=2921682 RepID=UPI0030F958D3